MDIIELTEIEKGIIEEALFPIRAARTRAIQLVNHILKERGADPKDTYTLDEAKGILVKAPKVEVPKEE